MDSGGAACAAKIHHISIFALCSPVVHLRQEESGATNEGIDEFGKALASGDFKGDGKADLAVGVPGEDFNDATNTGMVVVHYDASARGPQRLGQSQAGAQDKSGDQFGSATAVGDFNGDGRDDSAIGVPSEDYDGATDAGFV